MQRCGYSSKKTDWTVVTPEEFAKSPDAALRDADALIVRSAVSR